MQLKNKKTVFALALLTVWATSLVYGDIYSYIGSNFLIDKDYPYRFLAAEEDISGQGVPDGHPA